jgi:hypothetical protein
MTAPIAIMVDPRRICLGLPSQSPVRMVLRAPAKQPKLYTEVIVPCVFADGWPAVNLVSMLQGVDRTIAHTERFEEVLYRMGVSHVLLGPLHGKAT